jgi:quinol monooxygenase YgiN
MSRLSAILSIGEIKTVLTKISEVMKGRRGLFLFATIGMLTFVFCGSSFAQDKKLVIRIAKLRIDSTQLVNYKAALKEEIETAVRIEPGVLTLYAVSEKDSPAKIIIFEIYADVDAYKKHLETPHFKKYKSNTKEMIKSLELSETVPIALATKPKQ